MEIEKSEAMRPEEKKILREDFLKCAVISGNAEPQHPTMKQPDAPNSVLSDASLHTPSRSIETNSEDGIAQEPKCCEPSQTDLQLQPSQTNSESNTAQEPQCLGPFVKSLDVKCPKCSAVLTYYGEIFTHSCTGEHISRESRKKNRKCCFCVKEFSYMRSWERHIKNHFKKTYVKCSICGKCFTCETSFKMHAPIHTNQWPYHCDICGRGAASEHNLEIHKTSHAEEKSWMCDVCGAMFRSQRTLHSHKISHSEKKYECDICFAKFKTNHNLKQHKKIHSVREKYQCGDCSSSFSCKYQLKLHKEIKHDNNPGGESFICSVCNKEFKHVFVFKRHMYKHKHNSDIRYTCDMCKRHFSTKHYLIMHIAGHNGKRFSCSHCGKLFTQKGSVKRHVFQMHSSDK